MGIRIDLAPLLLVHSVSALGKFTCLYRPGVNVGFFPIGRSRSRRRSSIFPFVSNVPHLTQKILVSRGQRCCCFRGLVRVGLVCLSCFAVCDCVCQVFVLFFWCFFLFAVAFCFLAMLCVFCVYMSSIDVDFLARFLYVFVLVRYVPNK